MMEEDPATATSNTHRKFYGYSVWFLRYASEHTDTETCSSQHFAPLPWQNNRPKPYNYPMSAYLMRGIGWSVASVTLCTCVCLSVCLSVCSRSNQTTAWAINTKPGTHVLYDSRWGQNVKGQCNTVTLYEKPSELHGCQWSVLLQLLCYCCCRRGTASRMTV